MEPLFRAPSPLAQALLEFPYDQEIVLMTGQREALAN